MRSIAGVAFALMLADPGGGTLRARAEEQQTPAPVEIVRTVGHTEAVTALAFSRDGKTLATGSHDYTVKLWNVATGLMLRTIGGHPYEVVGVAFSGDGTEVLSVSNLLYKITVNVADAATGELKRTIENPKLDGASLLTGSGSVAFSPEGGIVALAVSRSSAGTMIEVIDTRTGASLHSIDAAEDVHLAFSPDGRYLAATGGNCALTLLDPASGEQVSQLGCGWLFGIFGTPSKFDALAFSGDGRTIAAIAKATLTQFDVASGDVRSEVDTGSSIDALAVSPDGSMVATASEGRIDIRDATGRSLRKVEGHAGYGGPVLAFSPDGAVLASGGGEPHARLWDAKNWNSARTLQGVDYTISGVAVTADGASVASDGSGSTVIWDAHDGRFVRKLEEIEQTAYGCSSCSIGFSPDGRLVAAGTRLAKTLIWEVASGRIVSSLKHSNEDAAVPRRSVAFLPSGGALVLGALSEGREPDISEDYPVVWDLPAQKLLYILKSELHKSGAFQWTYAIAVSPDGRLIAAASRDNVINLFDSQTGELVRSVAASQIAPNALAFSADGRILASANTDTPAGSIEMWDVATGSPTRRIDTHTKNLLSLAFSPDGRTLASGGDDRLITLWNFQDGTPIGALRGHEGAISSLVFAGNGMLVSGSHDGSVKIWGGAGLDLLATMAWEPDGEWIVFTPEGFFEAEGRANKLAIVRGLEAYPIDAAYDLLHRPDLVREKLTGDPQGRVKSATVRLDLWKIVTQQ